MKNLTTIDIDLDVYKAIQKNLKSFDETPNEVLRRILEIDTEHSDKNISFTSSALSNQKYYLWKGTNFSVGLKLRKNYKQSLLQAEIIEKGFFHDGIIFNSPSAAAVHATKTQVDGWKFWEYFDAKSNQWKLLDKLRNN